MKKLQGAKPGTYGGCSNIGICFLTTKWFTEITVQEGTHFIGH
jgi:hypothetical protein